MPDVELRNIYVEYVHTHIDMFHHIRAFNFVSVYYVSEGYDWNQNSLN